MCLRGQPSGERRRLIPAGQMAGRLNQQHVLGREGASERAFALEADGLKAEAVVGIREAAGAGTPPARLLYTGSGRGGQGGQEALDDTLEICWIFFFSSTYAAVKESILIENRRFI